METAVGLNWADENQELTPVVAGVTNLEAKGGFAKSIVTPVLSGLASLELLKLVTREEGFEKWVLSFPESSAIAWPEFAESMPIRSCRAIEKEAFR